MAGWEEACLVSQWVNCREWSTEQHNAMDTDQQFGGPKGGDGDGEDVEVIVLEDQQYREVFDTSLEVHMENVSLNDHDYSKGERSKEVRALVREREREKEWNEMK